MKHLPKIGFILVVVAGIALSVGALQTHSVKANPPVQFDDPVKQGEYLVSIAGCEFCHTPSLDEYDPALNPEIGVEELKTLALFQFNTIDTERMFAGGRLFDLGPAGAVYTANITQDEETGIGAWTDEQIKMALRNGINADGRRLIPLMPPFNMLAESDLDAIVAYLRTVPAVSHEVERMPELPVPPWPTLEVPATPPDNSDPSVRGSYLVNAIVHCGDCHTPLDQNTGAPQMDLFLSGAQPFEGPWGIVYAGNITPHDETGIGTWTAEDLKRAITTGVRVDGRRLGLMPWQEYAHVNAEDLDAIVHYLLEDVTPIDRVIPATALEEPYVEIVEGIATTDNDNDDDDDDLDTTLIAIISGVLIVVIGGVVLFVRKPKKAA